MTFVMSACRTGAFAACVIVAASPVCAEEVADATPLRVLFSALPVYPLELAKFAIEGRVTLDCAINPDGAPEDCVVTKSSDHRFNRSALEAEEAARYVPITRNGERVRMAHHVINITYAMPRGPIRTDMMLTCHITATGHAAGCTTTNITGYAAIEDFAQGVVEQGVYPPLCSKGVPVPDSARTIVLAVLTTRVLHDQDLSLPDLGNTEARLRLFLACKSWPFKSCTRVGRDEAVRLLHNRHDPVHPDLYAFEFGAIATGPDPK